MDSKIGASAKSVTKLSEKNYQPRIVVIRFMKKVDEINENSKICKEEQKHNFLKKQLKKTEEKIFGQVQRNTENNVIIRFMKKSDQTTENANTNRKISDFCYQLKKDTVKRKSNLNTTHLKSKFYECKDCNVSFTRRDNLQCHIKKEHFKEKPSKKWICQTCHASFKFKILLENHVNSVHLNEKPYVLEWCPKSFTMKAVLKKDFDRFAQKIQQHKCYACNQAFLSKSGWKIHIDKEHLKVKSSPMKKDMHSGGYFCFNKTLSKDLFRNFKLWVLFSVSL